MLGVRQNAVRYHLRRQADGATDGRARQSTLTADFNAGITVWLDRLDAGGPLNLAVLQDWLVTEHAYPGSLRSLKRYFRAHYQQPWVRAPRRVEAPAGAQAQADWGEFRDVMLAGSACAL